MGELIVTKKVQVPEHYINRDLVQRHINEVCGLLSERVQLQPKAFGWAETRDRGCWIFVELSPQDVEQLRSDPSVSQLKRQDCPFFLLPYVD